MPARARRGADTAASKPSRCIDEAPRICSSDACRLGIPSLHRVRCAGDDQLVAPDEEPRFTNLLQGLRQGLHAAGAAAGDVSIVEHRVARGDTAQARNAAASLRAANAQVAFVVGTELTRSLRSAAQRLPIVFITPGDPVRAGLAASLARPGNHLTGMTFEFAELSAKRLELLKEIAPKARRVGVVFDPRDNSPRQGFATAQEGTARLGVQLVEIDVETLMRGEQPGTRAGKVDGLLLIPGGATSRAIDIALKFAAAQRIASVVWSRNEGSRDATLSYGVSDVEVARSAARLVLRVLEGQPAGELPIEQPTRFELVINMKAAKALHLTWENCHFAPAVAKIIGQVIFAPMRGAQPDQNVIQQGIEEFRKYGAVANGQLEATRFLTGDKVTIADFAVAVWLSYEKICGLPVSDYPQLNRWWKAMQDLPGSAELAAPRS